jgi:hypothetical protein
MVQGESSQGRTRKYRDGSPPYGPDAIYFGERRALWKLWEAKGNMSQESANDMGGINASWLQMHETQEQGMCNRLSDAIVIVPQGDWAYTGSVVHLQTSTKPTTQINEADKEAEEEGCSLKHKLTEVNNAARETNVHEEIQSGNQIVDNSRLEHQG